MVGSSYPSINLVPGNLNPSSALCGHQVHTCYTDKHAAKQIHIKQKVNIKSKNIRNKDSKFNWEMTVLIVVIHDLN